MAKKDTTKKTRLKPRRRKPCPFCMERIDEVDFTDSAKLERFITDRGKIIARRTTALCAKHQRKLSKAIKRARNIGLMPYTID